MTSYQVQFCLPVDNPENKVRMTKRKGSIVFEVPINFPDAHNMGFQDLLAAAELSGLLGLSSTLNKTDIAVQKESSKLGATILKGHKPVDEVRRIK